MSEPLYVRLSAFLIGNGHGVRTEVIGGSRHALFFKSNGEQFCVEIDSTKPQLLRIFVNVPHPSERRSLDAIQNIALNVHREMQAIEVVVNEKYIRLYIEAFFATPDGFEPVFWPCVKMLRDGVRELCNRILVTPPQSIVEAQAAAERFFAELGFKVAETEPPHSGDTTGKTDAATAQKRPGRKSRIRKPTPKTGDE